MRPTSPSKAFSHIFFFNLHVCCPGACVAAGIVTAAVAGARALRPSQKQRYTLNAHESAGQDGPVEERVIEYERKIPFKGFKGSHLFPNEPNFRRGDDACLEGNVALASKEDLLLPDGWRWVDDDWSVLKGSRANKSGTDNDGWMYAFNWTTEYAVRGGMNHFVRRRIWVRRRAFDDTSFSCHP